MTPTPTDPREEKPERKKITISEAREVAQQTLHAAEARRTEMADTSAQDAIDYQSDKDAEIAKLAAEIAELKAARDEANESVTLNYNTILELRRIIAETEAELETAKLTLFQTEKRLDDKLRAALAELEAARKERDEAVEWQEVLEKRWRELVKEKRAALAAKDAASQRLKRFGGNVVLNHDCVSIQIGNRSMDIYEDGGVCVLISEEKDTIYECEEGYRGIRQAATVMVESINKDLAALTPAPTQEPPACPKCFGTGWIRQVGGKLKCECKQNPTGDDDGLFDNIPDFPAIGGVNYHTPGCEASHGITAAGVEILTGKPCTCGGVTISTVEKERDHWKATAELHYNARLELERERDRKGGDSSCAPSKEPTHPDSSKCASNSPADVPSEGRGEWMPIETAPKDGTRVLIWNQAMHGTPTAEVAYYSEPLPLDMKRWWKNRNKLFLDVTHWQPLPPPPMLPTEGSGA